MAVARRRSSTRAQLSTAPAVAPRGSRLPLSRAALAVTATLLLSPTASFAAELDFMPEGYVSRMPNKTLLDGPSVLWPPSRALLDSMWLCVQSAPGIWRESFPEWHDDYGSDWPGSPRLEFVDSGCVRPIESIADLHTLFAGSNMTFIGDSILREVSQDVFVAASGCWSHTSNHLLPNGEPGWWVRGGPTWHNISVQCQQWISSRAPFHAPFTFAISGDVGRKPMMYNFKFVGTGPGFRDKILEYPFVVQSFNETEHTSPIIAEWGLWHLDAGKTPNHSNEDRIAHYHRDADAAVATLLASPHIESLRKWFWWWIPLLPEDSEMLVHMNRTTTLEVLRGVARKFRNAGFKVLDMTPYTFAEGSNMVNVKPYLVSRDGRHFRTFHQNLALAREMFSTLYLDSCVPSFRWESSVAEAKANTAAMEELLTLWTFRARAGRGLPPLRLDTGGMDDATRKLTLYKELALGDLIPIPLKKCDEVWGEIRRWELTRNASCNTTCSTSRPVSCNATRNASLDSASPAFLLESLATPFVGFGASQRTATLVLASAIGVFAVIGFVASIVFLRNQCRSYSALPAAEPVGGGGPRRGHAPPGAAIAVRSRRSAAGAAADDDNSEDGDASKDASTVVDSVHVHSQDAARDEEEAILLKPSPSSQDRQASL